MSTAKKDADRLDIDSSQRSITSPDRSDIQNCKPDRQDIDNS